MAVEIKGLAHEELGDVGIAARSEKIVAAPTIVVDPVLNCLPCDGQHRPQIGKDRPEPVVVGEVAAFQLPGAGCPEALSRVVQVPGIEIDDLRPLDRNDATDLPGPHRPGVPGPDRHDVAVSNIRPSVSFAIRS